jgi:excisionase family DNA binding protein
MTYLTEVKGMRSFAMPKSQTKSLTLDPPGKRAFSVREIAGKLGVHTSSVYRLIYNGSLRTLPGLGRQLVSDVELERYLSSTVKE